MERQNPLLEPFQRTHISDIQIECNSLPAMYGAYSQPVLVGSTCYGISSVKYEFDVPFRLYPGNLSPIPQKLSMLLALLIQPQALLVDEPMVGLDPASIEDVLKIFTLLKEEGCAVFVSTHIIDIIKDIYDEAYIMNKGKIIKHVLRDELEDESLKQYFFELTDGE